MALPGQASRTSHLNSIHNGLPYRSMVQVGISSVKLKRRWK